MKTSNIKMIVKTAALVTGVLLLLFIQTGCSKNNELKPLTESASQQNSNLATVAKATALSAPYKVAYYAFDNGGLPLRSFAPDANVVVLFEGTVWAMADTVHYPFSANYISSNSNYKSYKDLFSDIKTLQSKGVKVLYNVDDDPAWQNTTALPTGTRGWLGAPLSTSQFVDLLGHSVIDSLHLDGIALDVEHLTSSPNTNYKTLVQGLGKYFGPLSANPATIYTAAIYDGGIGGTTIAGTATISQYLNFVQDMGYFEDNTTRFNQWAKLIGNSKTMIGVSKQYNTVSSAITAAQWQPTGSTHKAGIMVYAANNDSSYTGQVLRAVTP